MQVTTTRRGSAPPGTVGANRMNQFEHVARNLRSGLLKISEARVQLLKLVDEVLEQNRAFACPEDYVDPARFACIACKREFTHDQVVALQKQRGSVLTLCDCTPLAEVHQLRRHD